MGAKSEIVSATRDRVDEIKEQLETLTSSISEMANELQGAFDRNDRVSSLAGDMHFTAGEITGEFSGAAHNWGTELGEILEALAAAGE